MSRTFKDSKENKKKMQMRDPKSRTYLKNKIEGPQEFYDPVERKGRPGVLSDDWNTPQEVVDLYEYRINHEDEAA